MNDIFPYSIRLVDGREQQCLANDGRGSFLIAGHPRSLLVYLCIGPPCGNNKNPYPPSPKRHRFLVLFVVLKNGKEVIESINHFLDTQTYPKRKTTTSQWLPHNCPKKTWLRCSRCRSTLSCPIKKHCTKIYAIQQVMERYSPHEYDAITIFNSDNKIRPQPH